MSELSATPICPVEAQQLVEGDLASARLNGALDALIELLERGIADMRGRTQ